MDEKSENREIPPRQGDKTLHTLEENLESSNATAAEKSDTPARIADTILRTKKELVIKALHHRGYWSGKEVPKGQNGTKRMESRPPSQKNRKRKTKVTKTTKAFNRFLEEIKNVYKKQKLSTYDSKSKDDSSTMDKITELKLIEADNDYEDALNQSENANNAEEWLNLFNKENDNVKIFDLSNEEIDNIGEVFSARLDASNNRNDVIVDSGGTSHMLNDSRLFNRIKKEPIGTIKMADDSETSVYSKEDIEMDFSKGNLRLKGSLFVPKLAKNIVSVAKLVDEGYELRFDKRKVEIYDTRKSKYITGIRDGNLYYLFKGTLHEILDGKIEEKKSPEYHLLVDDDYDIVLDSKRKADEKLKRYLKDLKTKG